MNRNSRLVLNGDIAAQKSGIAHLALPFDKLLVISHQSRLVACVKMYSCSYCKKKKL